MRARRSLGYHPHPATIGRREAYRRVLWPYWLTAGLFAFALLCLAAAATYHAAPTIVPSPAGRPPTATGGGTPDVRHPLRTPPPTSTRSTPLVDPARRIDRTGGLSKTGASLTTDTIVTTCGCGRPGCVKIRAIPTSRWLCRTCLAAYAATHRWVGR